MKKLILLILLFSSPAWATDYFVRDDGSDSNTGLSDAQAWQTISKVNSTTFATGDDIYFKCDDTWSEEYLTVDWSGTAENRVIIGAYYGSGTIGVSGAEPIIDGNHTVPANQYVGLIYINGYNYITVQDLDLRNSYGQGVRFHNGATYGEAKRLTVNYCGNAAIQFNGLTTRYGLIESCTVTQAGMGHVYAGGVWSDWPLAIGATYASDVTVRSCLVHDTYTEGIGFYKGSDNCIAEYNVVYNTLSGLIYSDAGQYNIFRYNMVYQTDAAICNLRNPTGLSIGDEALVPVRSGYNQIYGNFVANCGSGIRIGGQSGSVFRDSVIYNNTLVGNDTGIGVSGFVTFSGSYIRNNIISLEGGTYLFNGRTTTPGLTWNNNNWSSSVIAGVTGTGDIIGTPLLSKTTGWRSLTAGSLDETDFTLQAGSPAIDAGSDLGDSYDDGLDALLTDLPDTVTLLDKDIFGAGWDIGAAEYKGSAVVTDPTGLIQVGYSTEEDVRSIGGSLVITLSDAVWHATMGEDNELTTALINGIDGNLSDSTAWDSIVKTSLDHTNVVRTSDSVVTITVPTFASYNIDTTETILTVIPASCTNAGADITCNSFYISAIQTVSTASGVGVSQDAGMKLYSPTGGQLLYMGE